MRIRIWSRLMFYCLYLCAELGRKQSSSRRSEDRGANAQNQPEYYKFGRIGWDSHQCFTVGCGLFNESIMWTVFSYDTLAMFALARSWLWAYIFRIIKQPTWNSMQPLRMHCFNCIIHLAGNGFTDKDAKVLARAIEVRLEKNQRSHVTN